MSDVPRRRPSGGLPPVVRKKSGSKAKAKPAAKPGGLVIAAIAVVVLLVAAGAFFFLRGGSSAGGNGASGGGGLVASLTAALNPFSDTPQSLIKDFESLMNRMTATLSSIQDAGSRDASEETLKKILQDSADLQVRVAKLDNLSKEEHTQCVEELKQTMETLREQNKVRQTQMVKPEIANPMLTAFVTEMASSTNDFLQFYVAGLAPLPEPKTDSARVDFDAATLRRDSLRRIARTEGDSSRIAAIAKEDTPKWKKLAERRLELAKQRKVDLFSPYQQVDSRCNAHQVNVIGVFRQRGLIKSDASDAIYECNMAMQEFDSAKNPGAHSMMFARPEPVGSTPGTSAAPSLPPGAPPQFTPGMPFRGPMPPGDAPPGQMPPGQITPGQFVPGQRPGVPGDPARQVTVRITGGPFAVPIRDVPPQERINVMRTRTARRQELLTQLTTRSGSPVVQLRDHADAIEIVLGWSGPPKELADKFDFAEVASIEEADRIVVLKITDTPE